MTTFSQTISEIQQTESWRKNKAWKARKVNQAVWEVQANLVAREEVLVQQTER